MTTRVIDTIQEGAIKVLSKPEITSKAREVDALFRKHKKVMGTYYKFMPFEEPVMFFIRRTGKVEWKEKVTMGRFDFTHSDGEGRYLIIDRNQLEFKVGDRKFKGYICHEDVPYPLPESPLLSTEMFDITINKTLHDRKEWEAKSLKAKAELVKWVAIGIAILIGAWALFRILVPAPPEPQAITPEMINAIQQNVSILKGG